MYKLIHIHTDFKFFHDTLKYKSPLIYNEIIFIGDVDDSIVDILQKLQLPYKIFNKTETNKVIEVISSFDGVVLNGLGKTNVELLNQLGKDVRVFLRLFGYELYKYKLDKFISSKTLNLTKPISLTKYGIKEYLKRKTKRLLGLEFKINKEKHKSIYSKIDAILLVNQFEYDELKKYFYLPRFIQVALTRETPKTFDLSNKKEVIIVGNSRHSWNNHLDIFKIIKKSKKLNTYKFILFFNYGSNNDYAETVKKEATQNNFFLVENFLNSEEFNKFYDTAAALIINSYRQHALGNIFSALLSGTKLYLNKKSSTYKWLKQEGFIISEITELSNDIDNNKVKLSIEEHQHNINCYNQMKANYTNSNFIDNIITVLKNE